jgi:hypothetical protein
MIAHRLPFQRFDVPEILVATAGTLVPDKVLAADEWYAETGWSALDATLPRLAE